MNADSERSFVPRRVGRLLLTGVPGWLTDRLITSLLESPLEGLTAIRCLVQPGTQTTLPKANGSGVPVEVVHGDLLDGGSLRAAVKDADSVVHAAAVLHVKHIRDFYRVNTEGTVRLAEAAAAARVGRFVYVSTNAAGGRSPSRDHLVSESDPAKPLSHYGRSKYLGEVALLALAGDMEKVVLRPSMFYGPPVPPRHVDVYKRILHGRMPLVGGGDYARSVVHVDNLVQATRLALVHPNAPGQTYYVADERTYTTREVTEAMARALGVEPRWIKLPGLAARVAFEADEQLSRLGVYWKNMHLIGEADWHVGVSVEKAKRELGYRPAHSLDEGMSSAIAWCRERGYL